MLKNLPQLVRFKTAMDVRIGHPNVHLTGKGRDEISQPMYATSVGLILQGIEYLEETRTFTRIGVKNQEPVAEHQQPMHTPPPVKEEPAEVEHDELFHDGQRRTGRFLGDRLRGLWDKIIEATDEKLDDTPTK